jgi:hypothetical protein
LGNLRYSSECRAPGCNADAASWCEQEKTERTETGKRISPLSLFPVLRIFICVRLRDLWAVPDSVAVGRVVFFTFLYGENFVGIA